MSNLSRVIHYYRQCYQASFHASEGHGIFDRDDVIPLAVSDSETPIQLSENQLSSWLVDSDQTELVLFTGFVLKPTPNRSFTTEVHYAPVAVKTTHELIQHRIAASSDQSTHFHAMLQSIDLAALKEQAPSYDDILTEPVSDDLTVSSDEIPAPEKLKRWLINQARKINSPSLCRIQVLALAPKDLRSYQAKQDFALFLEDLAKQADQGQASPVMQKLLVNEGTLESTPENRALLGKLSGLGFGHKLALPSLSNRQIQALQNAFNYPISLLQGPPGTGKTHALASLTVVLASLNKSVLLTAQSDAALDVLQQQLTDVLQVDRSLIVRFGKGQRYGRFAQQMTRLMSQANQTESGDEVLTEFEALLELQQNFETNEQAIQKTIENFPTPSAELLTGNGGLGERFKRWLFWQRQHSQSGSLQPKVDAFLNAVEKHHASLGAVASAVLKQRFQRAYARAPAQWSQQNQLTSKSTVKKAALAMKAENKQPVVMQSGVGIWLATLDDLQDCTYGNFDWVIIDEATQANMASVLPALAIAKSLVVSGDPMQLRHYSFLSNDQEQRIERELELQNQPLARFRSTSFFDFTYDALMNTGNAKATTLLDEHYRSVPPLMKFNSEAFYNDEVKVFTGLSQDSGNALHLKWHYVDGKRIEKVNVQEVNAVVQFLKVLIEKQESTTKESIGVLSFFADQTEALKKSILSELSLQQIRDHRIKIGTPFSFQGEERDHMLISCAVDENSVAGTWTYLNKPDVFNVATSRARKEQTLFLSAPPKTLPANSTLKRYHDYSLPTTQVTTQALPEPWLLALVESLRLAEPNLKVEYHHAIADIDIDILLSVNHKRLAIDLIGFPGDLGAAVHLNRYTTLKRVGIALYPLTAFDWMFNPDTVIDNIQAWLHDKADRLNQQLPVKAENNLVEKITTQPFVTSTPMSLVNEQVWLDFLECAQAPELSPAWGFDISDMVEKLTQMDQLLPKLFKTGSVTYLRYKSAINTALTPYLENLSTYRMLHSQVWEANNTDTGYWQTLTAPILERHEHITEVLTKLHREMQMEVAKGGKADDFALQDIEGLAERLGKY